MIHLFTQAGRHPRRKQQASGVGGWVVLYGTWGGTANQQPGRASKITEEELLVRRRLRLTGLSSTPPNYLVLSRNSNNEMRCRGCQTPKYTAATQRRTFQVPLLGGPEAEFCGCHPHFNTHFTFKRIYFNSPPQIPFPSFSLGLRGEG